MIRQLTIFTFVFFIFFTSFGQTITNDSTENMLKQEVKVDTSKIVVFELDSSTNNTFKLFKKVSPTELTSEDLIKIELILLNFIKEYNLKLEKSYLNFKEKYPNEKIDRKNFIIDFEQYKRQYYTTTNEMGEKEIWVNCFCNSWDTNWRKYLIFVFDGGKCYFNLKINLTKGEYFDIMVNGEA